MALAADNMNITRSAEKFSKCRDIEDVYIRTNSAHILRQILATPRYYNGRVGLYFPSINARSSVEEKCHRHDADELRRRNSLMLPYSNIGATAIGTAMSLRAAFAYFSRLYFKITFICALPGCFSPYNAS